MSKERCSRCNKSFKGEGLPGEFGVVCQPCHEKAEAEIESGIVRGAFLGENDILKHMIDQADMLPEEKQSIYDALVPVKKKRSKNV